MTEQKPKEPQKLGVEDTYLYSAQIAFDSWIIQKKIEKGELSSNTTFPPRAAQAISEILSTVGPDSPVILKIALRVDESILEEDKPLVPDPQKFSQSTAQKTPNGILDKLYNRSRWIRLNNR